MSTISNIGWRPPNITPKPVVNPSQNNPDTSLSPAPTYLSPDNKSAQVNQIIQIINNKLALMIKFKSTLEKLMLEKNCLPFGLFRDFLSIEEKNMADTEKFLSANNFNFAINSLENMIVFNSVIDSYLNNLQNEITGSYQQNINNIRAEIETAEKNLDPETKKSLVTEVEIIDAWQDLFNKKIDTDLHTLHPNWYTSQTSENNSLIENERKRLARIFESQSIHQILLEINKVDNALRTFLMLNYLEMKSHQNWRKKTEELVDIQNKFREEASRWEQWARMLNLALPSPDKRHAIILTQSNNIKLHIESYYQTLLKANPGNILIKKQIINTYRLFCDLIGKYDEAVINLTREQTIDKNQKSLLIRKKSVIGLFLAFTEEVYALYCKQNNASESLKYLSLVDNV